MYVSLTLPTMLYRKKKEKEKKLHRGSQILTIDQMEERAEVNLLHKAVILGPRELKLLCVPQPSTNDTLRRCLLVVPSNPKRQSRSGPYNFARFMDISAF